MIIIITVPFILRGIHVQPSSNPPNSQQTAARRRICCTEESTPSPLDSNGPGHWTNLQPGYENSWWNCWIQPKSWRGGKADYDESPPNWNFMQLSLDGQRKWRLDALSQEHTAKRIARDKITVQATLPIIESWGNPFALGDFDELINISTGVDSTVNDMLRPRQTRKVDFKTFAKKKIASGDVHFFAKKPQKKPKTPSSLIKKGTTRSFRKVVPLKLTKNVLAPFVVIARTRNMDLQEELCYHPRTTSSVTRCPRRNAGKG